jgi:RHS repeat-associated protein
VEFFNGATLLATATTAPYSYSWTNVPIGSYQVTAKATDNLGAATASDPVTVTITNGIAQAYFIDTDHLGTPRVITNSANQIVWQWDNNDPFGANIPDENPSGLGPFKNNLRFPGQYFDVETGLHYNYFRDCYDPATGRYCQSDPIGLRGGINTYSYALLNPISYTDPKGLLVAQAAQAGSIGIRCLLNPVCRAVAAAAATVATAAAAKMCSDAIDKVRNWYAQDGEKPASTPTGSRGNPVDVAPGTNDPTTIDGRDYTGHGLDQMQGRGVPSSAVEEAINNGTAAPGNTPGTTVYNDSNNGVTVVTDANSGRVVTVITTGRK